MVVKKRLAMDSLEGRLLMAGDVCTDAIDNPNCAVIGDSNGDGAFDTSDLVAVFAAGKYETGECAEWAEGDWNRDGVFNSDDFSYAFADGQFGLPADLAVETFIPGLAGKTCPPGHEPG